jgi:GMP synthase (glutamine-hydrolysing)
MKKNGNWVAILDFGSQYTQLIARRVRELSVYSEIFPFNVVFENLMSQKPGAIILSGGPDSVYSATAPIPDIRFLDPGIPVLGICFGMQLMAHEGGGKVEGGQHREYGYADLDISSDSLLFKSLDKSEPVWMSHGDRVTEPPAGYKTIGSTTSLKIAAVENAAKKLFGIQFHPEVHHTPKGLKILQNFLYDICDLKPDWTMQSFIKETTIKIKDKVPSGNIILGLSGGVDSSVTAMLLHKAVGDRFHPIFIDTGLLRKNEAAEVSKIFNDMLGMTITIADYSNLFIKKLKGVTDPEKKRKIIGNLFIKCFENESQKIGNVQYLAQGTLYPDVIESTSVKGPSVVIKSHHNVGGLPKKMKLQLIEPLRELFKDEVRAVGKELGLPDEILGRHPFPGPGLAVRILGDITEDRAELLRAVDAIFINEIQEAGWYDKIWQAFAVLLPVKSVGVMGDERTYDNVVAIRAVHSVDGMTADWVKLPYDILARISNRIINEIKGVNRVVYDITSKPPGTIEWE